MIDVAEDEILKAAISKYGKNVSIALHGRVLAPPALSWLVHN